MSVYRDAITQIGVVAVADPSTWLACAASDVRHWTATPCCAVRKTP